MDNGHIARLVNYDLELIESIIVCSVVPKLTEILTNYCRLNGIDLFVINHKNSNGNTCNDTYDRGFCHSYFIIIARFS